MFASSQGGGQELVISLLRPGLLPGAFFVGQSKNKPTKPNPDTGGAMAGLHTSKMNGGCRYGKKLADDPSQQQGKAPGQIVPCLLKVRPNRTGRSLIGVMRRHSGSAGCLAVTLPTDERTRRSESKRRSERGSGTREPPCGNHPSSSRATTTASKAPRRHSGSLGGLGVMLPTDTRWLDQSTERGSGTRDAPCGSHPSPSRAATMASKAHSMSLDFPAQQQSPGLSRPSTNGHASNIPWAVLR